jgi:3-deoxy-D-manno-octulosonate 8-phosphate phosphatase (KDO 8-P phosphatase)
MIQSRLAGAALIVSDVDGVMTDGGLYYDAQGGVSKRFHVQDGLGVKLAQAAGLEVAVITGLESEAVRTRIRELGIGEYHSGGWHKGELVSRIASERRVDLGKVVYVGDDWVDAPAMNIVGLPVAVQNAQPEIKRIAAMVTDTPGGQGALREVIMAALAAQGKLEALWRRWMDLGANSSSSA